MNEDLLTDESRSRRSTKRGLDEDEKDEDDMEVDKQQIISQAPVAAWNGDRS